MPSSNRGFHLVATLAAIVFLGVIGGVESRCQSEQDTYQARAPKQPGRGEVTQFRSQRSWMPCLIERGIANPEVQQASEQDKRDLIAQESAALWGFWVAAFALLQLVATVVGLIFIKRTLDATRKAVSEAAKGTEAALIAAEAGREANRITRAAQDRAAFDARWAGRRARREKEKTDARADALFELAQRNADAAAAQVKVAQDTAEKQLRPYLLFTSLGVNMAGQAGGHDIYEITFRITNAGQTPARIIESRIARDYTEAADASYERLTLRPSGHDGDIIPPNDSIFLTVSISSFSLIVIEPNERRYAKSVIMLVKTKYRGMADRDDVAYAAERGRIISFTYMPDDGHAGAHLIHGVRLDGTWDRAT